MPHDSITLTGRNFAPVKPLTDAKRVSKDDKVNPSSMNAFFREKFQEHWSSYETEWQEVTQQAQVISLLKSGKLVMKRDFQGTGFVFFRRQQNPDRSNYPLFSQNSETLTSKWKKAKVGVSARHFGDGYKTEIQLNLVDTMVKSYFRDIFDDTYEDRESASAQEYGTYITQFEYDDQLDQMITIVPVIQNQSKVLVDGYGACYDCGKEGHPDDFAKTQAAMPQCPDCGSYKTTRMVPDAVSEEAAITDVDVVSQGDIRGRLLDMASCRYDPHVLAHESDWFLYSERVPLRLVQKLTGDELDLDADESNDIGQNVLDALASRGGSTENNGENRYAGATHNFNDTKTLRSMWLKPDEYAGFRLKNSERTLAGVIPADVPFEEIFPNGICVRGFNDMKLQIGVWGEKANIASSTFIYQSHSGIGKGTADAVDLAKDINELYSMLMAGLKRYGAAGLVIDKSTGLSTADVKKMFRPNQAVFADLTQVGGDVNKAVMQVKNDPINAAVPATLIQCVNMLNLAFMTGDFSEGAVQDTRIDTLGGQQLATAKAEEKKGGIFGRKTGHRVQSAAIICDLARQHIKRPRYYAHGQDKHSTIRGKWISGSDLPERLKFDPVPDSEIPENKYEKRLAKQEMVEKAGGIAQFAQAMVAAPKLVGWYAEGFGQALPTADRDEVMLVSLARVEEIKDLAGVYQDPEQILQSLTKKLRVAEDGHDAKAAFLQEILDDDDFDEMAPNAQAAVELMIERHLELMLIFEGRQAMRQQYAKMQLDKEAFDFQQQMMAPQIAAQQQADQENQSNQALLGAAQEVGGRILDDEADAAKTDRQQTAADADAARQNDLADAQLERDKQLETTRATLRPAPAAKPAATR